MKKLSCLLLASLLLAGLAACGDAGTVESVPPTDSPAPAVESEEPAQESEPAAAESEGPSGETSLLETARTFEGAAVEELIAAIGEPQSSDYAPSCLGEGEDGNLYYDGFTVYTYRDGSGEVVSYVE